MIKVSRVGRPTVLEQNEAAWKQSIRNAANANDDARLKVEQNRYRHPSIRKALVRMFHDKCAYCESKISQASYPHIEHFRPKSDPRFYELAVDWDNLLLACGRCNGVAHKGTKFPEADEGGPLVNPTKDNPDDHFRFDFDHHAMLANVLGISVRGVTTEKTLGLNRKKLLQHRSTFVQKLYVIALHSHNDPKAQAIMDSAIKDDGEYAAFARMIRDSVTPGSLTPAP